MGRPKAEYEQLKAAGFCVTCKQPARIQQGRTRIHCASCNQAMVRGRAKYNAKTAKPKSERKPKAPPKPVKLPSYGRASMTPATMLTTYRNVVTQGFGERYWPRVLKLAYQYFGASRRAQLERLTNGAQDDPARLLADSFETALADVRAEVLQLPSAVQSARSYCDEPFRRYHVYVSPKEAAQ